MTRSAGRPSAQEVFAGDSRISEIDVGDMVDNPAIDFLRYAHVETTVACFHVEHGNLAPFRRNSRQAAVGVAEQQHCFGAAALEHAVDLNDDFADRLSRRSAGSIEDHDRADAARDH